MKFVIGFLGGIGFQELLVVVITVGIFLLIRSIVLWYWKVNEIIENQNKQLEEQQRTNSLLERILPDRQYLK